MIGLGVGIDYALFIVTRHKQELQKGVEVHESVARAVATSGSAVLFAGGTVVIALVSMAAAQIPLVTALGYTAAVTVLVAVAAALTLLPALLAALGPKVNSLPVHLGKEHPDDKQPHGWRRWARGVCNRPWPAAIASTLILVVLAIPLLDLQLGQTDAGTDPKDQTTRKAYDLLSAGFGPGVNGPFLIAVQLNPAAKADQSNIDKVNDQQKQLDQQQQQATEQGEAQGLSPDQAQQQAEQKTASQQQQLDDQKKQAENPASDPRLTTLTDDLKKTSGVKEVSGTQLDKQGRRRGDHAHPDHVALRREDRRPGHHPARQDDPARREGRPDRRRGRPDGRLRGPGRPHLLEAAAGDPDHHRAELRPADDRLPLDPPAAQGRLREPAVGGRGLRRVDRRVPGGLGRGADRPGRPGAHPELRAAVHVRDPVRALDGLRGVPAQPGQGALRGGRQHPRRGGRRAGQHRAGSSPPRR